MSMDEFGKFQLGYKGHEVVEIQRYLKRYGYLGESSLDEVLDEPTSRALVLYKKTQGLSLAGPLFSKEVALEMSKARCSVPDIIAGGNSCSWGGG